VLVPPDDVDALVQAVQGVLQDEYKQTELRAAARNRAEVAFDIRSAAARLIEQYELALS
jgi:glycosyltransferase involved in cell wall biosynthesis